jgi:spore cortex biosynthesis protein YabQ
MQFAGIDGSIYRELGIFCSFFLTGLFLGASYDLLRLLRGLIPHGDFLINLEDLLYWLYASLVVFVVLYEKNDGELRGYVFLGLLAGLVLYGVTVARICVPPLIRVMRRIRKRLLAPIARFRECIRTKKRRTQLICGKLAAARKKRLKKFCKMVKMGVSKL